MVQKVHKYANGGMVKQTVPSSSRGKIKGMADGGSIQKAPVRRKKASAVY